MKISGQSKAVEKATDYLNGIVDRNKLLKPILIYGPSGVGKSHFADAFAKELAKRKFAIHIIPEPSCIRLVDKAKETLYPMLESGGKKAIFIDEAHLAIAATNQQGFSSVVRNALRGLIYPHGQSVQQLVKFAVDSEEILVDFSETLIVLMTNEPRKLDNCGPNNLGEYPIERRVFTIKLEKYTEDEIEDVILAMVTARELTISDCALGPIKRFHRGTLQALSEVLDAFVMKFPDSKNITLAKLTAAARTTNFYYRGLNIQEVQLLNRLDESADGAIYRNHLNMDAKTLNSAISYLNGQRKDGKPFPFLIMAGTKIKITKAGRTYLSKLKEDGFRF